MLPTLALALALGGGSPLAEGRRLFDALQYQAAATSLEKARRISTLRPEERREVLDLLGRAYVALGHREEAELTFAELLRDDPDAALPKDASPKLQDVFVTAKRRVYPPGSVTLLERPAAPGAFALELLDPWREVAQLGVFERAGAGAFVERRVPAQRAVTLELAAGTDALYVTALAADGRALAAVGSAAEPRVVRAPEPVAVVAPLEPQPVAPLPSAEPQVEAAPRLKWPGWVLVGAAVACAAAGVALLLLSADDDHASKLRAAGEPGFYASDAAALNARARTRATWGDVMIGAAAVSGAASVLLLVWF